MRKNSETTVEVKLQKKKMVICILKRKIQQLLVEVGDKSISFVGSHQWIGCYESSIVLDQQYGVCLC